jgi:dTDP-4-dehydrorhamnose 3,5-epimerase
MVFKPTKLDGVFEICIEPRSDERGLFARTWCRTEFAQHGLNPELMQCSVSFNPRKGTLRGMHFQEAPHAEAKLIRCTRGEICDVVLDLRLSSKTYTHWIAIVLKADRRNMVYVPEGCAHGFLTLQDNTEVFYQMSQFYTPEAARGVRWNDPAFAIEWPVPVEIISDRDRTYPDFQAAQVAQ